MYKCKECDKEFSNHRSLNAHQIAHKTGTRYNVPRTSKIKQTHLCLYCQKEFNHSANTTNKFCSLECSHKYKWEYVEKPKIEAGAGGNYKKYLIEKHGECCSECGIGSIWNNKQLTIQLDHIDGNSDNNSLSNLRLLCPNCHSQTHTYGSKGMGNRYKKQTKRNLYLQEYKRKVA